MFENVPERLTNYLRGAAVDFDRESFYWFTAAFLGVYYLRKNFTVPDKGGFLNLRRTSRGGIWYGYSGRGANTTARKRVLPMGGQHLCQ
jgi:hypothetical protein